MKLITKEIERKLWSNMAKPELKRVPYLKLFNAYGSGTWLLSEINTAANKVSSEDIVLYGLCDLGQGYPELGYVSLAELKGQLTFGHIPMIERDMYWKPEFTLNEYYDQARVAGSIEF